MIAAGLVALVGAASPLMLEQRPLAGGRTEYRLVGRSATASSGRYRLVVSDGGGNQSIQEGQFALAPGTAATVARVTVGAGATAVLEQVSDGRK